MANRSASISSCCVEGPARAPSLWVGLLVSLCAGCGEGTSSLRVEPDEPLRRTPSAATSPSNLQRALSDLDGPVRVLLAPGRYSLAASPYEDPTCGNCEDPATPVAASVGLRVTGRGIELVGAAVDSVVVHTNAGYGILFEDCENCALRGITVTGGVRDPDGQATDGAVVVRRSSVTLERCHIRDNIGDSATVASVVVGIIGIVGREGAELQVRDCRIERNSWDGIALYRGARADIRDNIIDGVDKASGSRVGGGRGVGIGLTWDAEATVDGNLVRRYWKGIGIFVNAHATGRHNIVEDVLTWGIAYWAAGYGRPVAVIEENVVYQTGACGVMIERDSVGHESPGSFIGNALVRTAQTERYDSGEPYCTQRALAREAIPEGYVIERNVFHNNRQPGDAPREPELSESEFVRAIQSLLAELEGHAALREALFLRDFGRDPEGQ